MHMARHKRSKAYVDKSVQYALAKRVVLHWVLFVFAAVAITSVLQFLTENPFQSWSELARSVINRYGLFLLVLFVMVPAFVWDTVKLSHRFAGPMLRFRVAVSDLADGRKCKPIEFRTNDFWGDLAADFNRIITRTENLGHHTADQDTDSLVGAPES
jgi:hypothetical protein